MPKLFEDEFKGYYDDYLLYSLHKEGSTNDFIEVYERAIANKSLIFDTHLFAIKEYASINEKEKCRKSIIECTKCWSAIELNQIEPIIFLIDNEIRPLIDMELAKEIILTPKAN